MPKEYKIPNSYKITKFPITKSPSYKIPTLNNSQVNCQFQYYLKYLFHELYRMFQCIHAVIIKLPGKSCN
jgi:hypothetical protein